MLLVSYIAAAPARATYENQPASNPSVRNAAVRYDIEKDHKLALQYDVYAGGFKALNASLVMALDDQAYDLSLEARTEGFIGDLFPWKASYTTSGHAEKGALMPSIHTERSTWRNTVKVTEMSYGPQGKVLKATVHEGDKTTVKRDIDESLTKDTMDLLTGTLTMLQTVKNSEKCQGKFPVFDGKRRFNIVLKDEGKETLSPTKYSKFEGEARRCTVKVEPVAGFKKKDEKRGWMAVQGHTEARKKPPTLWLGRMKDSGQVVPVRMEIASDYGSVVAHLSGGTDE